MIKTAFIFAVFVLYIPIFGRSPGINTSDTVVKKMSAPEMITISVTSFGVKANSFENVSPGSVKAIGYCKGKENAVLKLLVGRIDLWPEGTVKRELYISNSTEADTLSKVKNIGFWLENFQNFTIEGNHTRVVLLDQFIPEGDFRPGFKLTSCTNVEIRDNKFSAGWNSTVSADHMKRKDKKPLYQ